MEIIKSLSHICNLIFPNALIGALADCLQEHCNLGLWKKAAIGHVLQIFNPVILILSTFIVLLILILSTFIVRQLYQNWKGLVSTIS